MDLKQSLTTLFAVGTMAGAVAQNTDFNKKLINFDINPKIENIISDLKIPTLTQKKEIQETTNLTGNLSIDTKNLEPLNNYRDSILQQLNIHLKNDAKIVGIETDNNKKFNDTNNFLYPRQ